MPFVVVNCSAIPPSLMESELFGFIKGAFTGAVANGTGKLEIADKGCVFLDDIDSLDTRMQAKLLRIIQEKEFQRLGSPKTYRIDTRFIAASNKNLSEWIAENRFREDLYYRLNVFPIHLPPLRQRRGDIPLLLEHFLELNVKKTGKPPKHFSQRAVDILSAYEWPGNVRELQNLVERLFTITRSDTIDLCEEPGIRLMPPHMPDKPLKAAVNDFERRYIADVLERVNGSRNRAASILGIHRNTLLSKIKDLGLVPDRSTGEPALNAAG